ncbi:hypothetical protein [uncultured Mucilaginibacter sp.]|uniref:hypothetical protein n=1 Tax=uncultured Mucilaginibacter sp. TaxID=797541 RepID=UPI00262542C8|nr:hypothetical protein [uncultured Mucilaginibacter sp.]
MNLAYTGLIKKNVLSKYKLLKKMGYAVLITATIVASHSVRAQVSTSSEAV